MSLPLSSLSSLTLSVSSTALTNPLTYEIPLSSVTMGSNSIQIPPTSSIVNAFNTLPTGTTFSHSLNASYSGGLTTVTKPGLSNFVAKKSTITPVISLANMIKSITSSQFILQPTFTNRGTGAISFTSSNANVATVNSSTGLVTIVGQGTTTITVSIAAAEDDTYIYAPASTTATLLVTSSPPVWTKLGQDLDGEAASDGSGYRVSLSGDGTRVAIGAQLNGGNGFRSGHVRVYQYNGTTWTQLGQDIDGEAAGDRNGVSVSLSSDGSIVAMGATGNDGNGTDSGHVRVYQYNGTTKLWTKLGQDLDGEAAGDRNGVSVSLSSDGTRLAIGANLNDGNGNNSGHVRVYQYNGTTLQWTQIGQDIDGEAADDYSGRSVSLSSDGTRVAIGANLNDSNGTDSGHVRVYQYNGTTLLWTQIGQDIDGEAADDYSGFSVSLSADGSRVAIGASSNDGNGNDSGHVRVYQYNGTTLQWTQIGQDIDGEAASDESGYSVSLSSDGSIVAIGADLNDGNGSNSGHTRVYQYNGTTWTRLGQDIDGEAANDGSGVSVSLSADGTRVAIGADLNDGTTVNSNRGHVRVYQLS
jgi:hypothetical protein